MCRDQGPSDLQSDALPTELPRLIEIMLKTKYLKNYFGYLGHIYQGFHQVWYQGIVKATVSGVLEDLTFKISEGSDQN